MTSIEERLLQDIDAVTRGLGTSERGLVDAREDLERRIGERRRADRRRAQAVVAAAASVAVGFAAWLALGDNDRTESPVGPITETTQDSDAAFLSGDVPTEEQLLGVWHAHDPARRGILWMFTSDGAVALDSIGNLSEDPAVSGTFRISDDAIVVEITDDQGLCADKSWRLRAVVNRDGGLNVVPLDVDVEDVCGISVPSRWVLDQVLPVPQGVALPEVPSGDGWDPPEDRAALLGLWYDPVGGYIVELRADGSYTILRGQAERADRGTWTVGDATTRLTLVSAADSASCGEGDQLVVTDLRYGELDGHVLQGDVARNECPVPFEGIGWFRLGLAT